MKKFVYCIPVDAYIQGQGWRASVVFENEHGHRPTGDWPYTGSPEQKIPYFWGHNYDIACKAANDLNKRMGISEEEAAAIVSRSMGQGRNRK